MYYNFIVDYLMEVVNYFSFLESMVQCKHRRTFESRIEICSENCLMSSVSVDINEKDISSHVTKGSANME